MFLGSRERSVHEADYLTVICEPTVVRFVTGIAVLVYMWIMFVPHRKHTCRPPRPVMRRKMAVE
jgi:hypothetical protein